MKIDTSQGQLLPQSLLICSGACQVRATFIHAPFSFFPYFSPKGFNRNGKHSYQYWLERVVFVMKCQKYKSEESHSLIMRTGGGGGRPQLLWLLPVRVNLLGEEAFRTPFPLDFGGLHWREQGQILLKRILFTREAA